MRRRERAPIDTTAELVAAVEAALPAAVRRSFGGGHPAKRVFQAVRIAVNDELESLDRALPLAWELLRDGGRLAAISFHSLEDRRVKRFLVERARGCVCPPDFPVCVCGHEPEAELLTRRAVVPTPGEVADNPRSRSGKLRAARKLAPGGGRLMAPPPPAPQPGPPRPPPTAARLARRRARRPQQRPARPPRRVSGRAAPAPARHGTVALPVRVRDAPFARALRARTSGVLDALLAGRGWIVLVGVLLVGIVFFNVDLLRMNREIALTAEKSTALKRDNARLRQEAALLGSSERIRDAAAELGLVLPGAGDVRYLKAHPAFDARKAARNIVEPTDVAALPVRDRHRAAGGHGADGHRSHGRRAHHTDPTAAVPDATATGETPAAGTVGEGTTAVAPTATSEPDVSTTEPSG